MGIDIKNKTASAFPPEISKELLDAFEAFLELVKPKEFSRNLRQMLFEFLKTEDCSCHTYFEDLIFQLDATFDLLEVMEDESESE